MDPWPLKAAASQGFPAAPEGPTPNADTSLSFGTKQFKGFDIIKL